MIKTPPKLAPGSTIALIAPSFGVNIEPYFSRLEQAIRNLTKLGYKIKTGPNVYLGDGEVASASPKARAKEFMDAYLDDEVNLILSVGGGELMNEMLPYVDFSLIAQSAPKWFMGFSDNTNLCFLLPILSGVKAIYGPNAPAFCEYPLRLNQLDAIKLLQGEANSILGYPKWSFGNNPEDPYLKKTSYRRISKIEGFNYDTPKQGTLIGGCLDCLLTLVGTRFDGFARFVAEQKDIIFYLESCDLNPISFRRGLWQLREALYFQSARLIMFGRPLHWGERMFGVSFNEAAKSVLGDLGIPLLFDCPLGHLPPSMPMVNGAKARVNYEGDLLRIDYLDM